MLHRDGAKAQGCQERSRGRQAQGRRGSDRSSWETACTQRSACCAARLPSLVWGWGLCCVGQGMLLLSCGTARQRGRWHVVEV